MSAQDSATESTAESIEEHDIPSDKAIYRHSSTDEPVEYLNRDDDTYYFSVNGGERTLELDVEHWEMYRDQLILEGYQ